MNRLKMRLLSALCLAVAMLTLWSCSGSDGREPDMPQPAPVAPDAPGTHRTILIYMVASNNLGTEGNSTYNISLMERWAASHSLNDCNVILYHMRYEGNIASARRVATLEQLSADGFRTVREYDVTDDVRATDPAAMASVMTEVRTAYPAASYGLVMWSHGDPWSEGSFTTTPSSRHWGADGTGAPFGQTYWSISLPPLGDVLTQTGPWEFIYFDSCYAANIETAYELRGATPLLIGSSTEVVSWGMPYGQSLDYLTATEFDPEALAQCTFDYYATFDNPHYSSTTNLMARSCTMSVIRTEALDDVASAARLIWEDGARFTHSPQTPIQPFMPPNASPNTLSFDMADTYRHLEGTTPEAVAAFEQALGSAVSYHAHTPWMWEGASYAFPITTYCGMGVYIYPPADTSSSPSPTYGYEKLAWYRDVMSRATEQPLN